MGYKGEIAGFPVEVVEKMFDYQVKQGNPRNVKLFEINNCAPSLSGGFTWDDTTEGYDFWSDVIIHKNFERFFEKYPEIKLVESFYEQLHAIRDKVIDAILSNIKNNKALEISLHRFIAFDYVNEYPSNFINGVNYKDKTVSINNGDTEDTIELANLPIESLLCVLDEVENERYDIYEKMSEK